MAALSRGLQTKMYSSSLLNKCECFHFSWTKILVESKFKSSRVLLYDSQIFLFFPPRLCCAFFKTRIISREVALLYIDDPNDRFLLPAEIRKRNVSMNIYDRSRMAITWLSYKVILCKLYLHNILPSLLSDVLRVRESLSIPQLFWLKQFTFFFQDISSLVRTPLGTHRRKVLPFYDAYQDVCGKPFQSWNVNRRVCFFSFFSLRP